MASPVVSPLAAIAVDCTGHRSCAAKHLAIDRLAAGPDVVRRSNQKHSALFSRGPLWERDRGTDKVPFGKLDAAITQNIVSGGVMKIEIG
jgi:hypothetical protein